MQQTENIEYLLQHTTTLLARHSDQILMEQLGIGYSQFKILRIVVSEKGLSQRQVADHLGQTEASISRQIKILINKNLITNRRNPSNKRQHIILITTKGLRLTEASQSVLSKYFESTLNGFSVRKQEELKNLLEDVHTLVCGIGHSTEPKIDITNV